MLPRIHRLTQNSDFDRLKKNSKLFHGTFVSLTFYDRKDESPTRFGFVISKKISKKAVVRNKIKRILSLQIEQYLNNLVLGYDVAFLSKPAIVEAELDNIQKEVTSLLTKAGIVTNK